MMLRKILTLLTTVIFLVGFSSKNNKKEIDVNNPEKLQTIIKTDKQEYQLGDDIELYFEVKNNTTTKRSFCLWHTPLEGFCSDYLNILSNKQKIDYVGIMLKRKPAPKSAFIQLKPGESKKAKIVINKEYKMLEKGTYEITFQANSREDLQSSNTIQLAIN